MSEFKGTKGKWLVFYQDDDIHIENEKRSEILTTLIGWNNHLEGKANALLISKAPEMLEMLELLIDRLVENDLGNLSAVIRAKLLIKQSTEL